MVIYHRHYHSLLSVCGPGQSKTHWPPELWILLTPDLSVFWPLLCKNHKDYPKTNVTGLCSVKRRIRSCIICQNWSKTHWNICKMAKCVASPCRCSFQGALCTVFNGEFFFLLWVNTKEARFLRKLQRRQIWYIFFDTRRPSDFNGIIYLNLRSNL